MVMLVDLLMDMSVHGGFGHGGRNPEADRILEFGDATYMVVVRRLLLKRNSVLVLERIWRQRKKGQM